MPDINDELQNHVAALKGLVAKYATSEVTNMLYAMRLRIVGIEKRTPPGVLKLESPARQQAFLLGLLLATKEPEEPEEFGFAAWNECVQLLNDAFSVYERLFVPDGLGEQSEAWWRAREVAGPVFLHYFNTGLIATAEQVRSRIQEYCVLFNVELVRTIGISASDSLAMMNFVVHTMQEDERIIVELQPKLAGEQERFIKNSDFLRPKDSSYRAFMREHYPILHGFYSRFERKGQVAQDVIKAAFPEQTEAFLIRYTISRGQGGPLEYPTEDSVFDYKPLIVEDDEYLGCLSPNNLFEAVLYTCETAMGANENPDRRRYFKHRDNVLERKGDVQFRRLMGGQGQLFISVFETPKAQYEHDIVIVVGSTVLVVEAKASPPAEPFRNPGQAFERLRRSFRADTGIQKGFEQAARIWWRLAACESVPLYTRTGELALTLTSQEHTECFCVCLTRDDFGHLATNLSLLLEKESAEPYPWAVNIWDLEAVADAWAFLR